MTHESRSFPKLSYRVLQYGAFREGEQFYLKILAYPPIFDGRRLSQLIRQDGQTSRKRHSFTRAKRTTRMTHLRVGKLCNL